MKAVLPRAAIGKALRRPDWTRSELERLAPEVGIQSLSDWYGIQRKFMQEIGGGSVLKEYRGSVRNAVMTAYPEHKWLPWRFGKLPNGFWKEMSNQKLFFEFATGPLNIKCPDDWYNVTVAQIRRIGGGPLMRREYADSIPRAVMAIFPEHEWLPWKFYKAETGYWESEAHQRLFFEWLTTRKMGWSTKDDWFKLTKDDVAAAGGGSLLRHYYNDSLLSAFKKLYPDHNWDAWNFTSRQQIGDQDGVVR